MLGPQHGPGGGPVSQVSQTGYMVVGKMDSDKLYCVIG